MLLITSIALAMQTFEFRLSFPRQNRFKSFVLQMILSQSIVCIWLRDSFYGYKNSIEKLRFFSTISEIIK